MASDNARKLFVAGLPDSVTEEALRSLFVESGSDVTELTLPRDRMTGRPRGFAFVRLGSDEDAARARSVLDGRIVDGRSIAVRPFQDEPPARGERATGDRPERRGPGGPGGPGGGPAPDRTLYVGNLPYDTTQEEVEQVLNGYGAGPVLRVHLPLDPEGRRRGFGFVTLGSAEAASQAIDALRDAQLRGRKLVVNLAHPKGAPGGPGDGPRPPRSFGGPPGGGYGGPPGGGFGGPPGGGFGGPPPAGPGRNDRKGAKGAPRKDEEGAGRNRATRRDREERWRDVDDDE